MVKTEHLTKKLGGFTLSDISIRLPKGYIMGIIGENGAGKTTLLRLLLGVSEKNSGSIVIDGMNYEDNEKLIKEETGFVLLEDLFLDYGSLIKNAEMYGKYYEHYSREAFLEYCERFHLTPEKHYRNLSKGEKLKFQFAFALSHAPKLLIMDEPTANFDREFRGEFLRIITEFVSDGEKSVVIATHLTEDLDRIADYVTFLHRGKLEFSMDREELGKTYRLVSGEDYRVRLIDKDRVIHVEKGKYGSRALIDCRGYMNCDRNFQGLTVEEPSIEDIMYYIVESDR